MKKHSFTIFIIILIIANLIVFYKLLIQEQVKPVTGVIVINDKPPVTGKMKLTTRRAILVDLDNALRL